MQRNELYVCRDRCILAGFSEIEIVVLIFSVALAVAAICNHPWGKGGGVCSAEDPDEMVPARPLFLRSSRKPLCEINRAYRNYCQEGK